MRVLSHHLPPMGATNYGVFFFFVLLKCTTSLRESNLINLLGVGSKLLLKWKLVHCQYDQSNCDVAWFNLKGKKRLKDVPVHCFFFLHRRMDSLWENSLLRAYCKLLKRCLAHGANLKHVFLSRGRVDIKIAYE